MPLVASPVDYAGIRAAFARAIVAVTGLSENAVVQMQAVENAALRPDPPFAAFMLTGLGTQLGWDAMMTDTDGNFAYVGPRQMTAQFQFYGQSLEQAFGLAALWAAALWQPMAQDILSDVADVQTWDVDSPRNITDLMATGYEGRAAVSATFGIPSALSANLPPITTVSITGP